MLDVYGDLNKRPLQELASTIDSPYGTIVFIEDLTGSGKTEAALDIASKLDNGMFFLLPTRQPQTNSM